MQLRHAIQLVPAIQIPAMIFLVGCMSTDITPKDAVEVDSMAFSKGNIPEHVNPVIVQIPEADLQPPKVEIDDTTVDVANGNKITTQKTEVVSTAPDGTTLTQKVPEAINAQLSNNQKWPVDSLVGQVNGKPLYASEFLKTREDRIISIAAEKDRVSARNQVVQLITEAFNQYVNNLLVISEAEAMIPAEAQEGVLAWLKDLQEKEIANRGGSRADAQRSIEEEFPGTTIEEFMNRQKNQALAGDLLNRRIRPRTIVSWRDVERLYDVNSAVYNPLPTIRIGRIAILKSNQANVDKVNASVSQGKSFSQVAAEVGQPDGGFWREISIPVGGIDAIPDLVDEVKTRIKGLALNKIDGPIESKTQFIWMTLISAQQDKPKSIFDPQLQLQLRRQIENQRYGIEQIRYFQMLRTHWVATDLESMKERLIVITMNRYFRQQ
ncbi:MAG: hypothetical protein EXS12_05640 [Phycisphaerales bacterium]|nr:hypothetical protein [Phycisphaerales bacterium]